MNTSTDTHIDTLISARYVIPVVPDDALLENHTVAIKDGVITDIFPSSELKQKGYQATQHHQLDQHILIPGLINCHGHAAMSLLRGYADDLNLEDWLNNHIWPAEAQWVSEEFVFDGTLIAIAEMIKSGTTTYSDMYFFPEQSARAAQQAGVRAQLTFPVFEFSNAWAADAQDCILKGLDVRDTYKGQDRIQVVFGPHAPYTVADASFEKIVTLSAETDMFIQVHLHETAFEVETSIKEHGMRPIERLNKLGVLTPRTQCVHMANLNDADIETIQANGGHVVHCPESNMKLASGACPVDDLIKAGVNVAIGTDSAASNNDLDLFSELKTAALLAKMVSGDPTALDAHDALRMATINGARAMGLEDSIGSIEINKQADLCAISIDAIEALPVYNPLSSLVYTNSGSRVKHVWVSGQQVLKEGELNSLNESELKDKASYWAKKISASK